MLKAPILGSMDRRIPESIDAKLQGSLIDKNGDAIFNETTTVAGFELVGDISSLTKKK